MRRTKPAKFNINANIGRVVVSDLQKKVTRLRPVRPQGAWYHLPREHNNAIVNFSRGSSRVFFSGRLNAVVPYQIEEETFSSLAAISTRKPTLALPSLTENYCNHPALHSQGEGVKGCTQTLGTDSSF